MTMDDWLPDKHFFDKSVSQIKSLTKEIVETVTADDGGNKQEGLATEDSPAVLTSSSGKMYKWQGQDGSWHFSNQKPQIESQLTVEALPEVKNLISAPVVKPATSSKMSSTSTISDITRAIQ